MTLLVNGDSHSAGAEAANPHCFAEDDGRYWRLGKRPHPDNLAVSYGNLVAGMMSAELDCCAVSASSNARIMRTTIERLVDYRPDYVIIGWSTWEREEWLHEDTYYQVTASGTDSVPPALSSKYKKWVTAQDHVSREIKLLEWHEKIFAFHQNLNTARIPHLFFNTYSDFSNIRKGQITTHSTSQVPNEYDWGGSYIDPYDQDKTYYYWCLNQGFRPVRPGSYHFGADAHRAWADFLWQHMVIRGLTQ
jgi:hypothetical protein